MNTPPALDIAALERRRRLSLRAALIALALAIVGVPLSVSIGRSDQRDTISGMILLAAIGGAIACPWIVRAWTRFMRRRILVAAVSARPGLLHVVGERPTEREQALSSPAFTLAAFRDSGLVETFDSAAVQHIVTGETGGVPFALAEMALLDAKGYQLFHGVLASFRLAHPRSGLTIIARDRGVLGNFLARAGSTIERLTLEDPTFEGVFEAYGTDQVGGRVILTTTTLERMKALDETTHARGFRCAFLDDHLLVTFPGMTWRCASWRILQPIASWIEQYRVQLDGLIDLPADIVRTLNLEAASGAPVRFVPQGGRSVPVETGSAEVFSAPLWRIVGEGGMPLITIASGAVFGGVSLFGGWYGIKVGYSASLFWYFWTLIAAGIAYGSFAIVNGVRDLGRLAWRWNAPLRTLKRQNYGRGRTDGANRADGI